MMIERGGKKYVVHPSKSGFVFVFDRKGKRVKRLHGRGATSTSSRTSSPNGELVGRRDLAEGKHKNLCPAIAGGYSWNAGTLQPEDRSAATRSATSGAWTSMIKKTEPITEPMVQLNIGANFTLHGPGRRQGCAATSARATRSPAR